MSEKIAIDFGTTNTVIAQWRECDQTPVTLSLIGIGSMPFDSMPGIVPSVVYIENEKPLTYCIGEQAVSLGLKLSQSERYFAGFKRMLVSANKGFPRKIGKVEFSYPFIGEIFLARVLAEIAALNENSELMFTVPVESFELYKKWIAGVCKNYCPGLNVAMLDEPTAAALGYGITNPESTVLVIDFGGGTLDISLVRLTGLSDNRMSEQKAKVIAKAGVILGGEDIDNWLLDDILSENGVLFSEISDAFNQMKREIEKLKIALSAKQEVEFNFFDAKSHRSYTSQYTRERFEDLLLRHEFYTKIQTTLDAVLHEAQVKGISKRDIEKVLLVGGTCLIPSVKRAIIQNFGIDKVLSGKPFEAISHGALYFLKGVKVEDYILHSYGLRYLNPLTHRHEYKILFESGSPYPSKEPVEIELACSQHNQTAIELVIGEIQKAEERINEIVFDGTRIKTLEARDVKEKIIDLNENDGEVLLVRLDPPGTLGANRLKTIFKINAKKQLVVTVEDLQRGTVLYRDIPVANIKLRG